MIPPGRIPGEPRHQECSICRLGMPSEGQSVRGSALRLHGPQAGERTVLGAAQAIGRVLLHHGGPAANARSDGSSSIVVLLVVEDSSPSKDPAEIGQPQRKLQGTVDELCDDEVVPQRARRGPRSWRWGCRKPTRSSKSHHPSVAGALQSLARRSSEPHSSRWLWLLPRPRSRRTPAGAAGPSRRAKRAHHHGS